MSRLSSQDSYEGGGYFVPYGTEVKNRAKRNRTKKARERHHKNAAISDENTARRGDDLCFSATSSLS